MIMPGITTASIKTSQKGKGTSPVLGPMFLFQKFQMDSLLCLMERNGFLLQSKNRLGHLSLSLRSQY